MSLKLGEYQLWPFYLDIIDSGEVGLICDRCKDVAFIAEAGIDTGRRFTYEDINVATALHWDACPVRRRQAGYEPREYDAKPLIERHQAQPTGVDA